MSLEGIRNKLGATQERSVPGGPGAAAVLGGEARALRAALVEKQLQQMPEEERVLNTEQIKGTREASPAARTAHLREQGNAGGCAAQAKESWQPR